ncbi:hypothetical protein [Brevundimonas guildfordensis]|uniref:TonB C-terminal domain-containing protein n=1 Tax=Brevundimonas guildfordensis TaxID=2762241 RepID=A0ABR8R1I1_9CAUL|nr:hypothetical protein [Brevundimonas guildfordensis]MBD7941631.1 hypothetical protein [Brevundimonas guildfordensis]
MQKALVRGLTAAVMSMAAATTTAAQDAEDWDLLVRPEEQLTVAYTQFDNGLLLAARCQRGVYQVMVGGLPAAPAAKDLHKSNRVLIIGIGDKDAAEQRFMLGADPSVAFSELPAPLARQMREGGTMTITVPGGAEDGRNLRYLVELPASNSAIDQSLAGCDRPLVDPRDQQLDDLEDDGLPINLVWKQVPRPEYPQGRTYTAGFAVVTCLSQADGRLEDCVVETEFPVNGGFGTAAMRGTRKGRLENRGGGDGPVPSRLIVYRVTYSMTDPEFSTGSRIRRNDE